MSLSLLCLPLASNHSASASGLAKRHRPAPRDPGQTVSVFGTSVLSGAMQSTVTIKMTGGFSVGRMTNLDWALPLAQSISVGRLQRTGDRRVVQVFGAAGHDA